jgi:hypothetical protein
MKVKTYIGKEVRVSEVPMSYGCDASYRNGEDGFGASAFTGMTDSEFKFLENELSVSLSVRMFDHGDFSAATRVVAKIPYDSECFRVILEKCRELDSKTTKV